MSARERLSRASQNKVAAERDLVAAATRLAEAVSEHAEACRALQKERKEAPLLGWTKSESVMDLHRYIRNGHALVRVPGDPKRPWRVKKGKGFITSNTGQIRTFPSAESAATAANELMELSTLTAASETGRGK
jgi:hypothetical protein